MFLHFHGFFGGFKFSKETWKTLQGWSWCINKLHKWWSPNFWQKHIMHIIYLWHMTFSTYLYCHLHVLNTIYFQWIASIELEEPNGILTPRLGKQEGFIKCPLENALSGCPLRKGIVPVLTNMPNDNSRLVKEISM